MFILGAIVLAGVVGYLLGLMFGMVGIILSMPVGFALGWFAVDAERWYHERRRL